MGHGSWSPRSLAQPAHCADRFPRESRAGIYTLAPNRAMAISGKLAGVLPACFSAPKTEPADARRRGLCFLARNIEMSATTQHLRTKGRNEDPLPFQPRDDLRRGSKRGTDRDPDQVRLHLPALQPQSLSLLDRAGDDLGVGVVFGKPVDMIVQRVQGPRG